MVETTGGEIGLQVLQTVQALGVRMDKLDAKVDDLRAEVKNLRAEVGCLRAEVDRREEVREVLRQVRTELKAEVQQVRTELKAEMQDVFLRLKARINLTDNTVVLMASVLRRPTGFDKELEQHLRVLEAR